MRVFIIGIDGYLGWPLALHLAGRGYAVGGLDCGLRRRWVAEMGSDSATAIATPDERAALLAARSGDVDSVWVEGDACDYGSLAEALGRFRPDAIVHLGQMPSAPYSMIDVDHAVSTHSNNLTSTLNLLFAMRDLCPDAHLVKLGSLGEYGTPAVDIPEGFFEVEFRGRRDRLPFPRQPNSFYHLTKVHDSANIQFASRIWGLTATDIMQGMVFGTRIAAMGGDPRLVTRFDFDQCFGTAVNRFCVQAVLGVPLTPYGSGGQQRGILPLVDSIQCLTLILENPPPAASYRVINQFDRTYTVAEMAEIVARSARKLGLDAEIRPIDNPRMEPESHYYNPDNGTLKDLGYRPAGDLAGEAETAMADLLRVRERIESHRGGILPKVHWTGRNPRG